MNHGENNPNNENMNNNSSNTNYNSNGNEYANHNNAGNENYNQGNNQQANYNSYSNQNYQNDNNIKKLYRSRNNKMLCGVCGGIANHFRCDPTIVRLLFAFLAFCSCGTALIAYIVMAIVVPETPFNE